MTSPQQPDTDTQLQLLAQHAAEAEVLEHAAAAATSLVLTRRLRVVARWLASAWVREFRALTAPADPQRLQVLVRDLRDRIVTVRLDPSEGIRNWSRRALELGVTQAGEEAGVSLHLHRPLAPDIVTAASAAERAVDKGVRGAERLLDAFTGSTHSDLQPVLAAAYSAVFDVERITRWTVNRAINQGVTDVADAVTADVMWIAERSACLVCIALSGDVVTRADGFDQDATFGTKPMPVWPPGNLDGPPRHPNCRCRLTVVIDRTSAAPLSDALQREARRSVLKGWSLPSESISARLQAADRLLQRGAGLPKSVEQEARRAVHTGHFRSRTVPTG